MEQLSPVSTDSTPSSFDKTKLILPIAIMFAAILVSGTLLFTSGKISLKNGDPKPQRVEVGLGTGPVLGNPNAKVTIVEFSDFQCPFCRSFWQNTYPQLKADYIDTGKAKLVFRHFPLTSIHPAAAPSANAFLCANQQNKAWELHDTLFAEQAKQGINTITYGVPQIKLWAKQISGLDVAQFNKCLDAGTFASEVERDANDGVTAGVNGTPTFFINGLMIVGAQPYAQFKELIDSEL